MPWTLVKHQYCQLPDDAEIRKVEADEGSIFQCGACKKHWVLADGQWQSTEVEHVVNPRFTQPVEEAKKKARRGSWDWHYEQERAREIERYKKNS